MSDALTGTTGSPGDELLRWISESGSGPWERLRDAAAHVCQKRGVQLRPWVLARDISALGHVDIDWSERRWSVSPPALNVVPGLGLCVVLTGSRPHHLDRRFDEATDDLNVYPFEVPQAPAPAAKFAKCASVEVAQGVAAKLGATLVIAPAETLVQALRAVDEVPCEIAPEPPLDEALRFDPQTLRWLADHGRQAGLYRVDLHGRPAHRLLDSNGNWLAVDLAVGQFLALSGRRSSSVLRWREADGDGLLPCCLEIRHELALPVLAERAATVSSGFLPSHVDGWCRYLNVSQHVAATIAERLRQELEVSWEDH